MEWFKKWKDQGRTQNINDPVRIQMKLSKKIFAKRLRAISKRYENESISEAARLSELDRDKFWRLFRRNNKCNTSTNAIKNNRGKAVYEIDDILEVWRRHFDNLSTPKNSEKFDSGHLRVISERVQTWREGDDVSEFLEDEFSFEEVATAIEKLNLGKAPGYDGVTSEHIRFAGISILKPLCDLFNLCVRMEYVPSNFRKGIQVPLYKGKNTCTLDPDNYRGITLLTTYNKLFEVLIWGRLKEWWFNERVISDLQGAGRAGSSCIHTALTLQETIAKEREGNRNVFVAYYDVSKAFDSVWIDGLFHQLRSMGITGSLWRILYKSYLNFNCCVRIGSKLSEWYPMLCGIHQGGYLSSVKYTAFINSLIVTLETSGLCSTIYRVPSSPVGYADDVAACTKSKRKMNQVMDVVDTHGNTWRYSFNAKKSAVLVFGETKRERQIGCANRTFSLGTDRVKEKLYYDHVGVKTCVQGDFHVRTEEKIMKARKALNMSSSIGLKRGGLNLGTCNTIFWTVIMPILCFGCEIWIVKKKDADLLAAFQRYAARRLQRFHTRSVNITSFISMGWMNIVNYVKARKLVFLYSIAKMRDFMPIKRIFTNRVDEFVPGADNPYDSPIVDALQIGCDFGILEDIRNMARGELVSKAKWKDLVWGKAWDIEREWWQHHYDNDRHLDLIVHTSITPSYTIWWQIADLDRSYMKYCEVMVKILCHCTNLKEDDFRYKRATINERMCALCDQAAPEDALHMIMQCPYHAEWRGVLQDEVSLICPNFGAREVFYTILGKPLADVDMYNMWQIWKITCYHTARMYWERIGVRDRQT